MEVSNNNQEMNCVQKTKSIGEFYRNKCIFVTGATGFIGKVLIEKLVRCCNVSKIYILLRPKNGLSASHRMDGFLNSKFFSLCDPDVLRSTIIPIIGDITQKRLGLSSADRQLMIENVSVVFHSAASVKFDDPIKQCMEFNVVGTQSVMELCHELKKLDAFVHVSTAYAYCNLKVSDEVLYPMKATAKQVLEAVEWMDRDSLSALCHGIFEGRPNTYTFTKALAEHFVAENRKELPMAIARPSIVTATWREPVPGWVDSINGPGGASLLGSLGIARTMRMVPSYKADLIPVDIVVNALIAIGWYTAIFGRHKLNIYNITSGSLNPITWEEYLEFGREAAVEAPSIRVVRPQAKVSKGKQISAISHFFTKWISEIMFAHFIDMILTLLGYKRIMIGIVRKMHDAFELLGYFALSQWDFPCNNVLNLINAMSPDDQEDYCCDVRKIDWKDYCQSFYMGIRRYLLKEDDSTIPKARKRLTMLRVGFTLVQYLFIAGSCFFILRYFVPKTWTKPVFV